MVHRTAPLPGFYHRGGILQQPRQPAEQATAAGRNNTLPPQEGEKGVEFHEEPNQASAPSRSAAKDLLEYDTNCHALAIEITGTMDRRK